MPRRRAALACLVTALAADPPVSKFAVRNLSGDFIGLWWIDGQRGRLVAQSKVAVRHTSSVEINSFRGHRFVVRRLRRKARLEEAQKAFTEEVAVGATAEEEEAAYVATLDGRTKVSWSATKKIGPFKARDFVTLCHFADLPGGGRIVVNRAFKHASRPATAAYERGEVVLAANIVRAAGGGSSAGTCAWASGGSSPARRRGT